MNGTGNGNTVGQVACWVAVGAWVVLRAAARLVLLAVELADELITARLGCRPVLPRLRRGWCRLAAYWRARQAGVIDAEVVEGEVWR